MLLFGGGRDYERLVVVQRPEIGLRAIVAVHSTRRGPAFGGIRRRHYASEAAALDDALELAEAMSHKCALAGLAAGGAKTVMLQPGASEGFDRIASYEALGAEIAGLAGQYVCGPDLGTGEAELAVVRRVCAHVNPADNDAGASTAAGVHAGLRAIWSHLELGDGRGSHVAIQGLGSVGLALAVALRRQGVRVTGADPDEAACRRAAELGVRIVGVDEIMAEPCDVLSPCATGHGLHADAIGALRCRAVCGSANNQLAGPDAARRLQARAIVHAPDVVVSAGAVIEGVLTVQHGQSAAVRRTVAETIASIETTLLQVLAEARGRGCPPSVAARDMARARLEPRGP
ncbi:MAG: Glu/Leu/Phe/Val dehydrogenase dimerization domain-containing protein [Nannocystaceae bacterium]